MQLKLAHGWGQYCHNSGAAGMWFGNPSQWTEARGLSWINVLLGILEDTPGSVNGKVLSPCKNQMKVLLPTILADLEVVHRLGKPAPGTAESVDVPIPWGPTPAPAPGYTPANPDMQFEVPPASGDTVQPAPSSHQATPSPPTLRPVLVKFASRRTRVMRCKKKLKSNPRLIL